MWIKNIWNTDDEDGRDIQGCFSNEVVDIQKFRHPSFVGLHLGVAIPGAWQIACSTGDRASYFSHTAELCDE